MCPNVATEPPLQPLSMESLTRQSANVELEARLDIKAHGFWSRAQDSFFDVQVFNPNALTYLSQDPPTLYRTQEAAKKREYNERVLEVEGGVFTPFVFFMTGGMGRKPLPSTDDLLS